MQQQMRQEGYACLPPLSWGGDLRQLEALSRAIDGLDERGLPPQFLLAFDEAWETAEHVARALGPIYGLRSVMDFFIFHVRPGRSGWSLHRDRPRGGGGFAEDGLPKYTTVWIALTEATPRSSCIYVLPAYADPEYKGAAGSERDRGVVAAFLPHVRALPAKAGTALVWSHRLLHWGSAAAPDAEAPRKTLTFAMAAPDFEQPLLELEPGALPTLEARLALVAYTLICYHHSQPVPPALRAPLVEIVERCEGHLALAAIIQVTGEAFFKNLLLLGETEGMVPRVQPLGERILKRFGMQSEWWLKECAMKLSPMPQPYGR